MAKKKAPPAPPAPTPARVRAAIRAGDFPTAVDTARTLHTLTPTPENLAVRKEAIAAAATAFAEHDRFGLFNEVMQEAETLDSENPTWAAERAVLLVRGGRLTDGIAVVERLGDPLARSRLLGHAVDRAIRLGTEVNLPEELQPGSTAVQTAFRYYEAGNDAAARAALETVGLRSPYLEWKVLLRGLIAQASGDPVRAVENFTRLDSDRLPARLAAPYRLALDPQFKDTLPTDTATTLIRQHEKLCGNPIVDGLRTIARELGRGKALAPAFKAAETVVPLLKATAAHLIPRLANCIYHALIQQGHPDDLARYRRVFGSPVNDPGFHKLQALINEQIDNPVTAHTQWRQYENWLSKNPSGWQPAILQRARAVVWQRMGECARDVLVMESEDDDILFARPRRRKPKPLDPPAELCFRRAAELAPDWPVASRSLIGSLSAANRLPEAEAVANAYLAHQPGDLKILCTLGDLLRRQGRTADAAGAYLRALAVNPLDKLTRGQTAAAILAAARHKLMDGTPAEVEAILDQHAALLADQMPAGSAGLRAVTRLKLGKPEEAAELRTKAIAYPGSRLSSAYRIMIETQLAKLKPADKRAADKAFADELAKTPTPYEVNQLLNVFENYKLDGVKYRGQKTHEKKLYDTVTKCLTADAPQQDFEILGTTLLLRKQYSLTNKLADACRRRFPQNPVFVLLQFETGIARKEPFYRFGSLLHEAKRLAEQSREPRHKTLLDRIVELQQLVASPYGSILDFFDRR